MRVEITYDDDEAEKADGESFTATITSYDNSGNQYAFQTIDGETFTYMRNAILNRLHNCI